MVFDFKNFKEAVKKSEDWLTKEYSLLHTGQASPNVLDGISVDSYGTRQPLRNVASISIEDPKTLRVVPWDKGQVKEIEKEIITSDLGLSVAVDQAGLRVIFPMLTTENREKLVKILKSKLEDARVSVKKEREEVVRNIEKMERESQISEDEKEKSKKELQNIVDSANEKFEEIFKAKEAVVMGK
ncbi:MAG: ribosome recycling factor [Bacteroidetes bacterium]|nr:ribosome recycling factor [Bacteroidota bacterium]